MKKKQKNIADDILLFEKVTIVSLNKMDMLKIKGGGMMEMAFDDGSATRTCDQLPNPNPSPTI
ncbi:hypothetical protein HDE69_005174 [Pedobacter cryoconitis]|uniref:Uncharacterized protein n=1 Tax=Pedobacter cryoconitis TaxID=188932 RepID=A0A7W8YYN5_9SPHI|nr:hypothetical protein [Pedobacter cryoconitis]MBB5624077.1 hypothetical protein [Pedobacter cryoconitis]